MHQDNREEPKEMSEAEKEAGREQATMLRDARRNKEDDTDNDGESTWVGGEEEEGERQEEAVPPVPPS